MLSKKLESGIKKKREKEKYDTKSKEKGKVKREGERERYKENGEKKERKGFISFFKWRFSARVFFFLFFYSLLFLYLFPLFIHPFYYGVFLLSIFSFTCTFIYELGDRVDGFVIGQVLVAFG